METGLIDVFTVTPLVSLDLGKKHEKMRTGMTSGNHTLFVYILIHITYVRDLKNPRRRGSRTRIPRCRETMNFWGGYSGNEPCQMRLAGFRKCFAHSYPHYPKHVCCMCCGYKMRLTKKHETVLQINCLPKKIGFIIKTSVLGEADTLY